MEWLEPLHRLLETLLPFEWAGLPSMRNALLEMVLLALVCAALGVKVVNFRMAFFSDAISHSAFTGVVLGLLLVPLLEARWPRPEGALSWYHIVPPITLIVFGLVVGLLITATRRRTTLATDTVVGVFFSTVIALGLAIVYARNLQGEFDTYLYGHVLWVDELDVTITAVLALVVAVFLFVTFNGLLLMGVNESLAHSRGVPTRLYDYIYSGLLALVVALSIRIVGLLLVTAMLVIPAASARNLARGAAGMLWWSILLGLLGGVGGMIGSWYLNTAAGATVVLTGAALFILTLLARVLVARSGSSRRGARSA